MHGMGTVGKMMRALGLMSGTSMDGIDVAFIETDGEDAVIRGPGMCFPYNPDQRQMLSEAHRHAADIVRRHERPGNLTEAERVLTELHAAAVHAFCRRTGIDRSTIDVIGFHGQTVLHRPRQRLTVQLGDGAMLAELTMRKVVFDLRAADVAAGGQGAPLVPIYHRALASKIAEKPIAVVNIGGVSNVTWIGCDRTLIAFDTGPGSALVDDLMKERRGVPFDKSGALAEEGIVNEEIVTEYLQDPFFSGGVPKSLDRNAFSIANVRGLSDADAAATLSVLTVRAIAKAREHFPEEPRLWVVCGGGRKNKFMMRQLAGLVENALAPAEVAGLDGDSLEAEAWAYIAVRSLKGFPITFPGTTGVGAPLTGGVAVNPQTAGHA